MCCSQLAGSKTTLNTPELPKSQSVRRAHGDLALIELQKSGSCQTHRNCYRGGDTPGQGHP